MADLNYYVPMVDVVGTVVSIVGLGFTIYVLWVAKGAKKAAEEARQAVLSGTRKRSLIEELEDVRRMIQQVGNLIQQEEWTAVHMQTEEIVGTCNAAMARWATDWRIPRGTGSLLQAACSSRSRQNRLSMAIGT